MSIITPKKQKTIFRIESKTQRNNLAFSGPYDFSGEVEVEDWADEDTDYHGDSNHPEPFDDKKLSNDPEFEGMKDLFCGFRTLNSLQKWFSSQEIKNLKKLGFEIYSYKSIEYIIGQKQVVFKPLAGIERTKVNLK